MTTGTPVIDCEQLHTTLYADDLAAAVDFYAAKLGFVCTFQYGEPPSMAGMVLGQVQIFLERGTPEPAGCETYFVVGDVDALHAFHDANGVEISGSPIDMEYGIREYYVRDLNGYRLFFGQRLPVAEPPLEIERVDVTVRLEKRLAALLTDLAARKHMSIGACLEETLLHSFERLDSGGVASPHTATDFRHIAALKQQHGIDYDCHASYRFVER